MKRLPNLARLDSLPLLGATAFIAMVVGGLTTFVLGSPSPIAGVWQVAIAVVIVTFIGLQLAALLVGVDADAPTRAQNLTDDRYTTPLFERWLRRSRHFRRVGALSGTILGWGLGGGDPGFLIIGGLAGMAAGGAGAELRSPQPTTGHQGNLTRVAELRRRRLGDYTTRADIVALFVLGTITFGLSAWAALTGTSLVEMALAAMPPLLVLTLSALALRSVVYRSRPALDHRLTAADDLMRRLAATQGFLRPSIALAIILVLQLARQHGPNIDASWLWLVAVGSAARWYWLSRQSASNLAKIRAVAIPQSNR